ncbi:hypothetical protein ACFWR9_23570 [Streptomyces sp. NPDC058534]|uniref:hypothetical protein n=1 Tax=Streptomyces sp. NPDC058534 TaxID=3346541 RepID=UPI003647BFCD
MPDDAQPPRNDPRHTPQASGNDPAPRPAAPGIPADGGPSAGATEPAPGVGLDKPGTPGTPGASGVLGAPGVPIAPGGAATPDPWAPPADAAPPADGGPGTTVAWNDGASWPPPSVHDQQTVTSMPATDPPRWAAPSAPANPFAAPDPTAAASTGAPNPFAPPVTPPPYAQDRQPVPPPPIAPDGPGHVPYGYPGPVGYGHPGPAGYPGAQPHGYGWSGMGPMPSNGMGTTGLVLGIIAAVGFCLWPLAIIVGILGVVFGALGRAKASRGEATNASQALAGVICGIVGIVLGVGFGLLVILAP